MAVHTLHTKQIIRATRQEAWDFFSNPRNLAKITPPELGFEILTPDLPAWDDDRVPRATIAGNRHDVAV